MAQNEKLEEIDGIENRDNKIFIYGRTNKTRYQIIHNKEDGIILEENSFEEDYPGENLENYRKTEIYDLIIDRLQNIHSENLTPKYFNS